MNFIKSMAIGIGFGLIVAAGTIYLGVIDPGADVPHSAIVHKLIRTGLNRAIAVRADDITVPKLDDLAMVAAGAGNYSAMCTGCHLAPGMAPTELSKGLYPPAPTLATLGAADPARAFWVIKHGIKASGMPAWGKSMDDPFIWGMVAFLQQAPNMTPAQYRQLVASSEGHSHGGGESMPSDHSAMPGMQGMDHQQTEAAAHDDTGSAPHGHDTPAPAAHDDTGSPPHSH